MAAGVYTMAQLAEILDMSESAMYRKRIGDRLVFDDGQEIPLIRIGGRIKIPIRAVDRLLDPDFVRSGASQEETLAAGRVVSERDPAAARTNPLNADRPGLDSRRPA